MSTITASLVYDFRVMIRTQYDRLSQQQLRFLFLFRVYQSDQAPAATFSSPASCCDHSVLHYNRFEF